MDLLHVSCCGPDGRTRDVPDTQKHAPKDPLANLILHVVKWRTSVCDTKHGGPEISRFMISQLPDERHGFNQEALADLPLHRVGCCEAKKVARGSVMDCHLVLVIEHGSPSLKSDTAASLNQVDGLWEQGHAVLGLEM
jgi:hypothetical protein